ncbi:MAG: hypothetical protein RLN70_10860, partial [Rhodospirillaceae bacterium]
RLRFPRNQHDPAHGKILVTGACEASGKSRPYMCGLAQGLLSQVHGDLLPTCWIKFGSDPG